AESATALQQQRNAFERRPVRTVMRLLDRVTGHGSENPCGCATISDAIRATACRCPPTRPARIHSAMRAGFEPVDVPRQWCARAADCLPAAESLAATLLVVTPRSGLSMPIFGSLTK